MQDRDAESLSIADIMGALWRDRYRIAGTVALCLAVAIAYIFLKPAKYTAVGAVMPVQDQELTASTSLSGLAKLGLASTPADTTLSIAQYMVTSNVVSKVIAADESVLIKIFEDRRDEPTGRWVKSRALLDRLLDLLGLRPRRAAAPDYRELSEYLRDAIDTRSDSDTPILTISFEHRDPAFAVDLVKRIVTAADDHIRQERYAQVAAQLAVFEERLKEITNVEQWTSLTEAMSDLDRERVRINNGLPYRIQFLDPPAVSVEPTSPRRVLAVVMAIVVGLLLGATWATLREAARRERLRDAGRNGAQAEPDS